VQNKSFGNTLHSEGLAADLRNAYLSEIAPKREATLTVEDGKLSSYGRSKASVLVDSEPASVAYGFPPPTFIVANVRIVGFPST